ncbi:MAG: tRNA (adenosine(37)-N6)-dimethylallyltransferase MiaA [Bacteriovoracaceae bacterium]
MLPKILVIVGPTASGKTALTLKIAEAVPSEIVSADSRQIYKYLTIGTAKPTLHELQQVPHHFIDRLEPDQSFNAGDFQQQGRIVIDKIFGHHKLPIVAGGTGLYVRAVVDGFFEQPEISGSVRKKLEDRFVTEGKEVLFEELCSVDPESAEGMDATKFRRVIRALEVFYETGTPISQFHRQHNVQQRYDAKFYGLLWERSMLYDRINRRVDRMIDEGFIEEVAVIQGMGFDDRYQSLQTVGYKEAFAFLRNEITKDRMIELMKQNTRRFAKRQMTWFRKEPRISWLSVTHEHQIEEFAGIIRWENF